MDIHEPIKRDRNLNITVIADNSRAGRVAVDHGVMLAEVFQASLTVMANFGFQLPDSTSDPDKAFVAELQNIVQDAKNSQIITDYVFPETLFKYAEEHNLGPNDTIIDTFTQDEKQQLLKMIKKGEFS